MFRGILFFASLAFISADVASSETLIKCGGSAGYAYFFADPTWNPEGPSWKEDGISNGEIRLVLNGDEFDIEFGDALGGSSYRQEGAEVLRLAANDNFLTIGAFNSNYIEIYTFDLNNKEVAWSSHKFGTLITKAATMVASCR